MGGRLRRRGLRAALRAALRCVAESPTLRPSVAQLVRTPPLAPGDTIHSSGFAAWLTPSKAQRSALRISTRGLGVFTSDKTRYDRLLVRQ